MGVHIPPAYQPVVRHSTLKTTFTGLQHVLSTAETPVHQYRGIKYATVPARFRQSKLFTSYRSSTDATRYGPICPQIKGKTIEEELFALSGSEPLGQNLKQIESECLNLNITCPGGLTRESRLPVMVWIHGGGDRGSGSHWLYDGGPMVQSSIRLGKRVILVTINYRLGLLGCAAGPKLLEDNRLSGEEGVGNYGLRDQRRALEWVHHFIADFGGDGSNVTVFGASTGASDILNHLNSASNTSYPLFARAIVQSPVIDHTLPSVSLAGVHLSKVMSALHVTTIQELRKVPIDKLVNFTSGSRAVNDGYFFADGVTEVRPIDEIPQNRLHDSEKLTAQCVIEQHIADTHGTHPFRVGAKVFQILHQHTLALVPYSAAPGSTIQQVIIVRRVGAICQNVKKANALLRAYDISAHTPDDEFPERLLELINDARFAWPTHSTAESLLRRSRSDSGRSVWRYVFDQEAPDPDILFPDHFDVDDDVPFDNSAFDNDNYDGTSSDGDELAPSVDEHQYMSVLVFGPEGEAGERGMNIFDGRRRTTAWQTALEPLGRSIVQKVGLELSNGPSGGGAAQLMQRQPSLEDYRRQQFLL
ncbi:alpha/beta-hydrolase [Russula earlei]|uniref:Alpha/beta-hydrolase n=1 Tax=Russula earlei TaxID=71964 RepID=A0ACC0U5M4_9AGAM|nr:alpha/beta-hydrolase [Russula earlei]